MSNTDGKVVRTEGRTTYYEDSGEISRTVYEQTNSLTEKRKCVVSRLKCFNAELKFAMDEGGNLRRFMHSYEPTVNSEPDRPRRANWYCQVNGKNKLWRSSDPYYKNKIQVKQSDCENLPDQWGCDFDW